MSRRVTPQGLFMADGLTADAERNLAALASVCAAVSLTLGVAGVVGWSFDLPLLRHLLPGFPAIRPLSALCIGLLGGALWSWSSRPRLSVILALLCGLVASLSLVEPLAGFEAMLRGLLVTPRLMAMSAPEVAERVGVTTPIAAAGYVTLAIAIVFARYPGLVAVAQTLAITVFFTALVPVLGYLYRIDSLVSPWLSSAPSLHGSLGIALVAVGILCKNPQRGSIGLLASSTAGSRAARRLLVPALAVPMILGGVFIYFRQTGTVDVDAAVPTFVCALAATLAGSVLWAARSDARTEILYRRSEDALRAMADDSPLMMWMADASGNGSHMNPAMLEFLGLDFQSFRELGRSAFVHPDDIPIVMKEVQAAMKGQRTFSAEFRVRHADGSWRWVLSTGMPRFTPANTLSGYTGSWVDVTVRKDAEAALQRFASELETRVEARTADLRASKEELARQTGLLESIVKSMGDAVLAVALDGEVLLSNDASLRLFGASAEDAPTNSRSPEFGFFLADGVTPYPSEQLPLIRALGGESVDNAVMIARHRSAHEGLWVRITARPIRNPHGAIIGSIIVGRDVTDFERALEATRRLAAVVESSGDAILSISLDGLISSWNRGAEQMYGYSADEALGVPLTRLDPSLERRGLSVTIQSFQEGVSVIRRDSSGRRHDGTVVDIATTMSPIHDEAGTVTAISVVHHDVTHLKAAERRIHALNTELEAKVRDIEMLNNELELRVQDRTAALVAANHDLENYASSVAHDLRTPLRAIAGFARVLEEDYAEVVGDEGRRVIGVVRKNAQDMGAFIDALLSFSAVERQPPHKVDVDVAAIVRECVDSLGADCGDRDVVFHVGDLPRCRADAASLKQVFLNLLANSVKFTRGRDQAQIEIARRLEPGGALAYYVRDNGVGFDMSNTRRLFGIFQRLHAPTDFEGTGLGLANVARIVAAHGGRVWAEAEPGKGATFYFIIEPREGGS